MIPPKKVDALGVVFGIAAFGLIIVAGRGALSRDVKLDATKKKAGAAYSLTTSANYPMLVFDESGKIVDCSPAAAALFNKTKAELQDQKICDVLPKSVCEPQLAQLIKSGPLSSDTTMGTLVRPGKQSVLVTCRVVESPAGPLGVAQLDKQGNIEVTSKSLPLTPSQ